MDLNTLTGVAALPNASIASPGEVWTNGKASEVIVPGEAIFPIASGGKANWRVCNAGDDPSRISIAFNVVQPPDANAVSGLGPNELANKSIPIGQYVRAIRTGAFWLTLVRPDATYAPYDLIGWDEDGTRPTGKGGAGSWAKNAQADVDSIFEVIEWRPITPGGTEGLLGVKFVGRGNQF